MVRPGTTFTVEKPRFGAGHSTFTASWSATLSRSGQMNSWRPQTTGMPGRRHHEERPVWNERIPVWEQRIPEYSSLNSVRHGSPSRRARTPFNPETSVASHASHASTVTRDWSLLLSPGAGNTIRRPWPEYEPEAAAAVGRRWNGHGLGRLYEHHSPSVQPNAHMMSQSSLASMPMTPLKSPDAGY